MKIVTEYKNKRRRDCLLAHVKARLELGLLIELRRVEFSRLGSDFYSDKNPELFNPNLVTAK